MKINKRNPETDTWQCIGGEGSVVRTFKGGGQRRGTTDVQGENGITSEFEGLQKKGGTFIKKRRRNN